MNNLSCEEMIGSVGRVPGLVGCVLVMGMGVGVPYGEMKVLLLLVMWSATDSSNLCQETGTHVSHTEIVCLMT